MGTAPPCGFWGHFPEHSRIGPRAEGGSLGGLHFWNWGFEITGTGLSETRGWVPGHMSALQQTQRPDLGAFFESHHTAGAHEGYQSRYVVVERTGLSLVGQYLVGQSLKGDGTDCTTDMAEAKWEDD